MDRQEPLDGFNKIAIRHGDAMATLRRSGRDPFVGVTNVDNDKLARAMAFSRVERGGLFDLRSQAKDVGHSREDGHGLI